MKTCWLAALMMIALPVHVGCAEPRVFSFEDGLPAGAAASGEVTVVTAPVHEGTHAVRLGRGAELTLPVAATDGFGTVSCAVYDSGLALEGEQAKARLYGPLWGLANSAAQRLCFGLLYAPYLDGNGSYGWVSTAENGWGSRRYARVKRTAGWHVWKFTVTNETDLAVTVDGKPASGFDLMGSKFLRGFSGVYLRGSVDLQEPLLVDDVRVAWQAEPLAPRTRPLPGEKRAAPETPPLALRPDLAGQHPHLFFTAAELPAIRERCRGTHADFYQRLKSGADSYLGLQPPAQAAACSDDQALQQWPWWRLTTLAFAYLASGDERYGRKAVEWLDTFVSYPDWGTGEEMNQSMGAANALAGVACTYDWCYDLLSETQRQKVRAKLLRQVGEMCWAGFLDPATAGYWKCDEQNNHRHHRLAGLTLGALAIDGEEAEAAAYAGFALQEARKVAAAVPPDGSSHEGPSYQAFGYSYVVLTFEALRHATGQDLYAAAPGLRNIPWFRAHMLVPGNKDVFNFSDCGSGTYYFNHYLFRLAGLAGDAGAQGLLQAAYEAAPDSFSYYPWDILWHDAALKPAALGDLPRARYFEDLEVAAYRSSWTDPNALAVFFKCGPYGGHRLNELAQGYVNIAHDHPDAGSFLLHWQGQRWALDDGYPRKDKAGANHNLVLIDGKGPLQRGGGWLQPIPNMARMGRIDKVVSTPELFAVRGDATAYYPGMTAVQRWLAVVGDRYVVICDNLVSAQGARRYDWLLHAEADWAEPAPGRWRLTRGDRTLHLAFALPAQVSGQVRPFELEGKARGQVLAVTPAQPAQSAQFVAVLAADDLPPLQAAATAEAVTVTLGTRTLVFALPSGDVTLQNQ